ARGAAPSRPAAISGAGDGPLRRADRIPLAGAAAGSAPGGRRAGRRAGGRLRGDLQRKRREAERADVHVPGLRDRRLAMIALTRAGWLASAALFGLFLASILHTHFAGPVPFAVLTGVAILSAIRPAWALPAVRGLVRVAE